MEKNQRSIVRAAALVTVLFALSRALGLVRTVVFGYYFGTSLEMDAYTYASRVPELLFNIVAGGALGAAFIPIFTSRLTSGDDKGAWQMASALVNLVFLILAGLSVFGMALAPWLVRTFVASEAAPVLQERIAHLMRIMLLSPAIFGVSGIVMGTLNGYQHFLLPGVAPILYNLTLIGGAVWGGETGNGTLGAALGTVIGALLHLVVQIPGLVRYGANYTATLGLHDPAVRRVGFLMLPRVVGVAAVQFNFVITNNLASGLEPGAVSILGFAWMLVLLPNILAQAVGTTSLPTFSAQAAEKDLSALQGTLSTMLRTVLAVMLPATVGLAVLGRSFVALAFERGAFSAGSTGGVAWAMAMFAVGLAGHGAIEILARAFYAMHDTWIPALAAIGAGVLNVLLGLILPPVFEGFEWPAYGGLALANGLAVLVEAAVLLLLIGPKIGGFPVQKILMFSLRALAASLGMGGVVWVWLQLAPAGVWIQTLGGIIVGAGTYWLLALAFKVDELRLAMRLVLRRG
ncbi:MAG: murein biosynthesis integral membrane protein MurJ [Anaerolineae bacterium]|nr:murein biosynthesis integral membrane protein MurJ [Anaerolineae bacterium]